MKNRISLCMIVKNEEKFMETCLLSVKEYVDEIIIVDTGSTDKTVEIASKYTDKIYHFTWINDFAAARNESLRHATGDWILVLDADEVLEPGSGELLRELTQSQSPQPYYLRIVNNVSAPDAVEHYLIRLFDNSPDKKFQSAIHEQLTVDPDLIISASAQIKIIHNGYGNDVMEQKGKIKRNIDLIEEKLQETPEDPFHLFNLGHTLMFTNRIDEAADALGKCVRLLGKKDLPSYIVMVYNDLVSIRMMQGNAFAAVSTVMAAPVKCHAYPDFMTNAGFALLGAGRPTDAIKFFNEALNLRMVVDAVFSDKSARTWRPWFGMARAYADIGNEELFQECIEKGKVYIQGKEDDKMVVDFLKSLFTID